MKRQEPVVTLLIRSLKSGGAEKQSLLLARMLQPVYRVHLVIQKGSVIDEKYGKYIFENEINSISLDGFLLLRIYRLFRFLRKSGTNIIISYLTSDNFLSGLAGKLAGVDLVVGGIRNERISLHKFLANRFFHRYFHDYTIFNNFTGYRKFIEKGFLESKSLVIHNGIDSIHGFRQRERKQEVSFITVARFVEQKDHETSIRAFSELLSMLKNENIEARLILVGFGPLQERIEEWSESYQVREFIRLIINPENVEACYEEADVYLSTSMFEGFSNSIMEAMNHSLPVIATSVGDNRQLVSEGQTGYLVDVKQPGEVAGRMYDLCTDYEKRIAFGKQANKLLTELCSAEAFRDKYLDFIHKAFYNNHESFQDK